MNLQDVITSLPEWENKTASELVGLLNAPTVEVVDEQLYTWAGVALIAGTTGAEALRLTLDAHSMGWVVHQLGGSGIQLSNPLVQQVLLGFAKSGVPGCTELAKAGIHNASRAELAGVFPIDLSDVESAVHAITLRKTKDQMRLSAANRYNTFIAAIDEWDGVGQAPIL